MTTKILPLLTWRAAICDSGMPAATRHVALTLSLYMNERGGSAFPGATRLAHDTGLHVSTVRERLKDLVAAGWLTLVSEGGLAGECRTANVYQARVPLASDDPSCQTTRRLRRADPSSQTTPPLVSDDPISSMNSSMNSSGEAADAAPSEVASLVAGYVDDYRVVSNGHNPDSGWRGAAGAAIKRALKNGETANDIAICLGVIANEGKNPNTLAYVLADFHAGRERRRR